MDDKVLVITTKERTCTVHIPDIEEFVCGDNPIEKKYTGPFGISLIDISVELSGVMRMKNGKEFECSFFVDGNLKNAIEGAPFTIKTAHNENTNSLP